MLHVEAIMSRGVLKYRPHTREFKGADLSGHNLSGWCLIRADLTGTDLSNANLSGADLCGAILKDADLQGIILNNTYLNACDLSGANISHWRCVDTQGFHVRGAKFDLETIDVSTLEGAHDCHELVAALLLREFPRDFEVEQICECIIARRIACWHGLVDRLRNAYPHRMADLVATWAKYPAMNLTRRWELGIAMANCRTIQDWEALRGTDFEREFPVLVRGWIMRTKRERGLI